MRAFGQYLRVGLVLSAGWSSAWASEQESGSSVLEANAPLRREASASDTELSSGSTGEHILRRNAASLGSPPSTRAVRPRSGLGSGLAGLAVVLGLIGLVAWGFRRFVQHGPIAGHGALQVVAKTYLGSKQSLAVVKFGPRLVLIGITPQRITTLATVRDAAEVTSLLGRMQAQPRSHSFSHRLERESALFGSGQELETELEDSRLKIFAQTRQHVRRLVGRIKALTSTT